MAVVVKKKGSSWPGRLIVLLFSLPFASVGVFAAGYVGWCVYDWWQMQKWVEVPCEILEVVLEVHSGGDSNTHKVRARFKYQHQGGEYESDRVGIMTMSDNIGSFHEDKAAELKRYKAAGQGFRCFVNPADPQQAVLYRELRWGMIGFMLIFVLVFGGVGFGLMFGSLFSIKQGRAEDQRKAANPTEPWMWDEQWASGEIKCSNKGATIGSFVFAGIWNAISAPLLFVVPKEVQKGNHLALLGLLFPAVGACLAVWAVMNLLRWLKYGDSVFRLASIPGVLGGQLAGLVQTNVKLRPEDGFRATLSCVKETTTGSGKNRRKSESVLWQDERRLQRELAEQDFARSVIPIQFHIPYDLPAASGKDDDRTIKWKLDVEAAVPGLDYKAVFEVPVFKTPESSPDYKPAASALADYEAHTSSEDLLRAGGIQVQPTVRGTQIVFPLGRSIGAAIGLTLFWCIWIGFLLLMFHLAAPLFFPIVFGLFSLLIGWGALDLWLWTSRIEVWEGWLTFKSGILGLRTERTYSADDVKSLAPKRGSQMGNKLYYMLELKTADKKKHHLGKRLSSQHAADSLSELILSTLRGKQ